jgi:hypothetical protein
MTSFGASGAEGGHSATCYGGPFTSLRNFVSTQLARHDSTMVYQWDDKEAECYQLYVEEKRSLDEVMAYWEVRGFTPRYDDCAHAHTALGTITNSLQQARLPDAVQGMLHPFLPS